MVIRTTLWLKAWTLGSKDTAFRSDPDCEQLCGLEQGIVFLSQTSASVQWCQFHSPARVCAWPGTRASPPYLMHRERSVVAHLSHLRADEAERSVLPSHSTHCAPLTF